MSTDPTPLIHAELVTDGLTLSIPERMGVPRDDQMQGTLLERLGELAGRVCYDSLGKGRASFAYHEHIQDVRHLSVYEHCAFTVEIRPTDNSWLPAGEFAREKLARMFLNRPGVWVRFVDRHAVHVTLNLRSALEWARWTEYLRCWEEPWSYAIWNGVVEVLHRLCPQVTAQNTLLDNSAAGAAREAREHKQMRAHDLPRIQVRPISPETDDECWISMLLCGSRGFSHELVRHGDFTAISQRSTRYVDEGESPWVEHPLIREYNAQHPTLQPWQFLDSVCDDVPLRQVAGGAYSGAVATLESWLISRGVEKGLAIKQARGAARGYLGNALYTEVIFSANIAQWRRMIAWADTRRASDAADAEIREVFVKVLRVLQANTHYGNRFTDMTIRPAKDGIGEVADPCLPPPSSI